MADFIAAAEAVRAQHMAESDTEAQDRHCASWSAATDALEALYPGADRSQLLGEVLGLGGVRVGVTLEYHRMERARELRANGWLESARTRKRAEVIRCLSAVDAMTGRLVVGPDDHGFYVCGASQ